MTEMPVGVRSSAPAAGERAPAVEASPQPASGLGLVAAPSVLGGSGLGSLRRSARGDPMGGAEVPGAVAAELRRRRGAGDPLPDALADAMGDHFRTDLSGVRVHADPRAGEIARSVQASAFTHGDDIYFAPGAYRPASTDGQRMLAHEVSHIAAQRSGADAGVPGPLTVGRADDPAEAAADRSADRAMAALRRTSIPAADGAAPLRRTTGVVGALRRNRGKNGQSDESESDESDSEESDSRLDRVIEAVKRELADSPFLTMPENEIQAGFDLWFGVRKGNAADVDVTKKNQAAVEGYIGGGAAVTGRAAVGVAEHEFPFGMTTKQYEALAQASALIGVHGKYAYQLRRKLGTKAYTGLKGAISGFAGAKASAQASGKLSMVDGYPYPVGFALAAKASAFAGAESSGNAGLTLAMNPAELAGLGIEVDAAYDAKAGAMAEAGGEIAFDPLHGHIVVSGSASAFAGASIEVSVSGSAKLYGRKTFTVTTSASASAGAGGMASGGWSLRGGKFTISGKAMAALGGGLGGGIGMEADFKPLAVLIYRSVAKAMWKARDLSDSEVRESVTDPAKARQALDADVVPHLEAYRDMKLTQLRMNKASEYVKMEKIQAIIDMNWPRPLVKKKSQPVDTYIENMLKKVFGDDVPYDVYDAKTKKDVSKTVVVDARVDKGKIKVLQFVPRDIASILGGTVSGRHGRGENANAAYSPHGLAQGI